MPPPNVSGLFSCCEFEHLASDCPSTTGEESFEWDGCGFVEIPVLSGSSPVREMVFGTIGGGGIKMPTLKHPFAVVSSSEPVSGGTDCRVVSVAAWGSDRHKVVTF
jgi:hypothetical protein